TGIYRIAGFIQPSAVTTSNIFGYAKNGGGNEVQLLSMTVVNNFYYFDDSQQLNAGDTIALNTSGGGFTFNAGIICIDRISTGGGSNTSSSSSSSATNLP